MVKQGEKTITLKITTKMDVKVDISVKLSKNTFHNSLGIKKDNAPQKTRQFDIVHQRSLTLGKTLGKPLGKKVQTSSKFGYTTANQSSNKKNS